MKNSEIERILQMYGIPYYIQDGNVYADSMEAFTEVFEHVENVTAMSRKELMEWLRY